MSDINNISGVQDVTINTVAKHIRILSQNTVVPLDSNLQKISDSNSFSQKNESIIEWMLEKKLSNKDIKNITWNIRNKGNDSLYECYVSNLPSNNNSVNDQPTEKQLSLLKSLGVISGVPKTKQDAAETIESILKNKHVTNQQREDLSKLGVSSSDMPKNYSDAKEMIWDVSHPVSQNTAQMNSSENYENYERDYDAELEYCEESVDEEMSELYDFMNCMGNEMDTSDFEIFMEEAGNNAWENAWGDAC